MREKTIYSTKEAAQFLELSVQGVKHHIYNTKDLAPDGKIGQAIYFTRSNLESFKTIKRKAGRPPHDN